MKKSFKMLARDAKKRIKSGFWENSKDDLKEFVSLAEKSGLNTSKVERYYTGKISDSIKGERDRQDEEFYEKVKQLLLKEGEVSDAIGRLTDREHYMSLSFEERQRYTLELSEKYLRALERFKKECEFDLRR